jgi:dGTPase
MGKRRKRTTRIIRKKTDPRAERIQGHIEKSDDTRSPYEVDGDRILYSTAFRRLAGVTQVVWPQEQQVFHTRLTHTLEVAQVARRIAQYLQKNDQRVTSLIDPDIVTAAAMAHDLGHPPFAHIGEETLNNLIEKDTRKREGFEGNAQSFRIVTKLARRDRDQHGLNLTCATLDAILKYPWMKGDPQTAATGGKWGVYRSEKEILVRVRKNCPEPGVKCLEAAIMDYADDIAYSVHDIFDFQRVGLLPIDQLFYDEELFYEFVEAWDEDHENFPWPKDLEGREYSPKDIAYDKKLWVLEEGRPAANIFQRFLVEIYSNEHQLSRHPGECAKALSSRLIHRFITSAHVDFVDGKPRLKRNIESQAPETRPKNPLLNNENQIGFYKRITWHYLIKHPRLNSVQEGQKEIIKKLYEEYREAVRSKGKKPLIPGKMMLYIKDVYPRGREQGESEYRLAADIICSLTDIEAYQMYWRMTGSKMPGITDISIW